MNHPAIAAIEVRALHKTFRGRPALRDVSLRIDAGEMVALIGASGSGKSTLLRHLNGLHRADAGSQSEVKLFGHTLQRGGQLAADARAQRAEVAAVFQQFNLVDRLPVMTNVLTGALHRLPLWRAALRWFPRHELDAAWHALQRVGIDECAWQRASTLSGGQQQRAAVSRALVQKARVILADEPIASLDPASSQRVMQLLTELNQELGVTVVVSLHQIEVAFEFCPRAIALRDGVVVYDGPTRALGNDRLRDLYGADAAEALISSQPRHEPGLAARRPVSPFPDLRAA